MTDPLAGRPSPDPTLSSQAGPNPDVIVIGAGAAGLMCAAQAGRRERGVLVLDHAKKPGEKIRISGGGRCNFTNLHAAPENYLSSNPRFCVSALKSYTQRDFIALVEKYGIAYHERSHGQLFCDLSATLIVDMLLKECADAGVQLQTHTHVNEIAKTEVGFSVATDRGTYCSASLVVACGGKSIPKMGATGFGFDIARQFGLKVVPPRAGLVPLTFEAETLARIKDLSGIAVDAEVRCRKTRFREALLFTHRGLSGPAILQISSFWREGEEIAIDLAPGTDAFAFLKDAKESAPRQEPHTALSRLLPKRLAQRLAEEAGCGGRLAELPDKKLRRLAARVNDWRVTPKGTEGYRTAEVTLGGVDTRELSSKTMECKGVPGLYFIGEVVDVTGHLGGFNFQWAWSSGHAAGRHV